MNQFRQKLLNNIICVILVVIALLIFFKFRIDFRNVLVVNIKLIGMITPFCILLFILYKKYLKRRLNMGELLTIFSILLALLFFSFEITNGKIQEAKEFNGKVDAILATTLYNCANAKDALNLRDNNEVFRLNTYLTKIYEDNFNIFYSKIYSTSRKKGDNILSAVSLMQSSNKLIDMVIRFETELVFVKTSSAESIIRENMKLKNNDIASRSEKIYELLSCDPNR